jgi:Coenzyme PQQ synthesis protein D (PqqD)
MTIRYIARSPEIAARLLAGEMIIMSVRDSTLFTLNPVATAIWQAIDGLTPLREIVEGKVCAQFDIDPRTAYTDAEAFVEELASHGILVLSDQPISVWPMPVKEGSWAH